MQSLILYFFGALCYYAAKPREIWDWLSSPCALCTESPHLTGWAGVAILVAFAVVGGLSVFNGPRRTALGTWNVARAFF